MSKPIGITIQGQRSAAKGALAAGHPPIRSLYLHVPFCFHKCHYCDFYSFVDKEDRQEAFVNALVAEVQALAPCFDPDSPRPVLETIFIGGGTPSLLKPHLWESLLEVLHASFRLATAARDGIDSMEGETEFTVECNPETVTPELMSVLRAGGVNRVSIGAQSFNDGHLKTLERWHEPRNVARALRLAAEAGIPRSSIDLIYGIPGQSLDDWRQDLETALELRKLSPGFEHISCYALTYEAHTAMTMRRDRGEIAPIEEDVEAAMFEHAVQRLADAGLERYEVSNFARPGRECRHNMAYWRQEQWLAAGPSASAHVYAGHTCQSGGWRWKNVPRLTDWMESVQSTGGWSDLVDIEEPDPRRALAERVMTGLRLSEGIDGEDIVRTAESLGCDESLLGRFERQCELGAAEQVGNRWRLTARGFLIADLVVRDLMRAIRQGGA